MSKVLVVGAGLAGSEAANYLASKGIPVVLAEVKRIKLGPAQKNPDFAELVCTNSLKSKDPNSGHGLLKYEMQAFNSLVLNVAQVHAVPAGDALAVDRDMFAAEMTKRLSENPLIEIIDQDVVNPLALAEEKGCQQIILATGPLTTDGMSKWIQENISGDDLYFYDAIAPVVDADSLDYSKLYFKDRHKPVSEEEGEQADYLNVPLNQEEYEDLINEMVNGVKVQAKDFEDWKFFEACLPVDLMAERGVDTARFSCMKPIGLEMPDGKRPYACIQLRKENLLGSAFNLVGFQTRLTYPEQVRIFRKIPGFQEATFIHLGSVHRNSFLNANKLLNFDMSSKKYPQIHFAGQISGVEGYTESSAMGLYVGYQVYRKLKGLEPVQFPVETGIGCLVNYIMTCEKPVPSNINFGLLPPVTLNKEQRRDRKKRKKIKKQLAAERARSVFDGFLSEGVEL
ncbi:MAG: methylenetetrahydrofolate--tRNA-(uracil(54)-C(5))-methyltransferase (FADH(2)-oxidizing) TrmFO [Deltaproteobacteria bacterium]|nr:MAG: methylenetetrahydrofolate--tRNA-(uracil(54)-C(5))-methyltransferase (FADH(2)-oxidizing) TrmFO [Deltaproteobacteria bacterium]TNF32125.1 MAG: methylenetetrahydrofolate--tRNA-(uracil(54)-C(5))-methyltransferase (FADH(2)-oxidizing) TrmFO [Deltaproteobacteria bacterium]